MIHCVAVELLLQDVYMVQVIQAVFFGICVLTDLSSLLTRGSGNQEQERQLKKLISLRDWMLAVLAFPVGVFVVAVFWIIYAYDREMIYPKLLDNFIPGWLNHGMVTAAARRESDFTAAFKCVALWVPTSLLLMNIQLSGQDESPLWPLLPVTLQRTVSTHDGSALYINRDEDITPSVSQQEQRTHRHMHLLRGLYIMSHSSEPQIGAERAFAARKPDHMAGSEGHPDDRP
ncbi:Androgen-induced gene 1 protein [Fukomys damarensis]|uniref:Androgen-induced gene 1 protein n=1 Tax=Fukomys damarensis TaxID=885580 RepID=A0A091DPT5_FUKDA|nr:Androgen-induced gene 1 protein [Fukomys damarensis]